MWNHFFWPYYLSSIYSQPVPPDSELTSNRDDNTRRYLVSINSTIVQIQEDTHAPSNQYYREYGLKTSNFVPYPAFFPQIFVRYRRRIYRRRISIFCCSCSSSTTLFVCVFFRVYLITQFRYEMTWSYTLFFLSVSATTAASVARGQFKEIKALYTHLYPRLSSNTFQNHVEITPTLKDFVSTNSIFNLEHTSEIPFLGHSESLRVKKSVYRGVSIEYVELMYDWRLRASRCGGRGQRSRRSGIAGIALEWGVRYLYVTSFWEKINKRPSSRLILLTLSLSLHILIIHSYTTRIPKGNALRLRLPTPWMEARVYTKDEAADFSTRIYSCSSTAVARSFSSEAGVKVIRRYSLYVAHIQWCRSFNNPHPPPSRSSRISYILPISPKWGGRRARFRSSARFFPPLQETDRYHYISFPRIFEALLTYCFRRASGRRGGLFYAL